MTVLERDFAYRHPVHFESDVSAFTTHDVSAFTIGNNTMVKAETL